MGHFLKLSLFFFSLGLFSLLSSCSSAYSDDEDLITQPVTNNPLIVPNYGSAPPGLGGDSQPRSF